MLQVALMIARTFSRNGLQEVYFVYSGISGVIDPPYGFTTMTMLNSSARNSCPPIEIQVSVSNSLKVVHRVLVLRGA